MLCPLIKIMESKSKLFVVVKSKNMNGMLDGCSPDPCSCPH